MADIAMSELQVIEERLSQVERELDEIKQRLPSTDKQKSWIESIAGTFKNDPEFDEIVRLGREF